MGEITNALATGKEVITHTDRISVPGWSGEGYILFDPATGDGAYKTTGGNNGGFFAGSLLGGSILLFVATLLAPGAAFSLTIVLAAVLFALAMMYSMLLYAQYGDQPGFFSCFLYGIALLGPLSLLHTTGLLQIIWNIAKAIGVVNEATHVFSECTP